MANTPINPYFVYPSGGDQDSRRQYTDEAITGLFSAHVENLCSERATIWQRYGVMVGVHTFLLGALGALIKSNPNGFEVVLTAVFGLALCYLWLRMTIATWKVYRNWDELARRFHWSVIKDFRENLTQYSIHRVQAEMADILKMNPYMARELEKEVESREGIVCRLIYKYCESRTYYYALWIIVLFFLGYIGLLIDYFVVVPAIKKPQVSAACDFLFTYFSSYPFASFLS